MTQVGNLVGTNVGPGVSDRVGDRVGDPVGSTVGPGLGLEDGEPVGASVFHSQVCPAVVQSPSEQWWGLSHPHRWPAQSSSPAQIRSQIPYSVASQPWLPPLQACRVGHPVGVPDGLEDGAELEGERDGAELGASVGAGVVGAGEVGAADGELVGSGQIPSPSHRGQSTSSPRPLSAALTAAVSAPPSWPASVPQLLEQTMLPQQSASGESANAVARTSEATRYVLRPQVMVWGEGRLERPGFMYNSSPADPNPSLVRPGLPGPGQSPGPRNSVEVLTERREVADPRLHPPVQIGHLHGAVAADSDHRAPRLELPHPLRVADVLVQRAELLRQRGRRQWVPEAVVWCSDVWWEWVV